MDRTAEQLRSLLDDHRAALIAAGTTNEFLDLTTAEELRAAIDLELDRWSLLSHEQRRTLADAVDYLVEFDDEEHDGASPIGLEDDREVVEQALRSIRAGGTGSAPPST